MSGGRVELGLGAGWYEQEHLAYGIPFPSSTGERFERLEEQLAIVTGLWQTPPGETFGYQGRHFQLDSSPALPKPVQRPHPPIIVGGKGPSRTPRLAARFADEFNAPFLPPADARRQYQNVRNACEAAGRDPASMRFSFAAVTCCGADAAEIARRAGAIRRKEATLRAKEVCGTPAEVVDRLGEWADAGAETAYLQILDLSDLDHLRLIGREVLPALRDVEIPGPDESMALRGRSAPHAPTATSINRLGNLPFQRQPGANGRASSVLPQDPLQEVDTRPAHGNGHGRVGNHPLDTVEAAGPDVQVADATGLPDAVGVGHVLIPEGLHGGALDVGGGQS